MLAAGAQAKEIVELKICGSTGCVASKAETLGKAWETNADPAQVYRVKPSAFYTVRIDFGDPEGNVIHSGTAYWVPRSNVMRYGTVSTGDPWWRLFPAQASMLRRLAVGVEPFTPRLARARVGGRTVHDPSSYLGLFGDFPTASWSRTTRWVPVTTTGAGPNPWASGEVEMRYAPALHVLERPDGWVRIPAALGARLMRRASLGSVPAATTTSPGGSRTVLYAGIGLAGLALAGLAAVATRRRAVWRGAEGHCELSVARMDMEATTRRRKT